MYRAAAASRHRAAGAPRRRGECWPVLTTSTDQYGSTLARWFGVAPGDLASVLPNVGRFATDDLGFLG